MGSLWRGSDGRNCGARAGCSSVLKGGSHETDCNRGPWAGISAYAQKSHMPSTDEEKIADALRAGPTFITHEATILDWPAKAGGEYRVLRKGTSEWACLPGVPGYSHDEPGCFDPVFLQWMKDGLAGRKANIDRVGIAYMYRGAWVPNKGADAATYKEFHVGPHIMVVSPDQNAFKAMNRDGSNGMPYVTHLPNQTDLFLVIPVVQWERMHPKPPTD